MRTIQKEVDVGDFANIIDGLQQTALVQIEHDAEALETQILAWAAVAVAERAQRYTRAVDAIYRASMINAWRVVAAPGGVDLVNTVPWSAAIEYGRHPGPADFGAIHEWTRVKLFGLPPRLSANSSPIRPPGSVRVRYGRPLPQPRRVGSSRGERGAMKANRSRLATAAGVVELEDEAHTAAINIHRHIEENGTEPLFILRDAMVAAGREILRIARKNLPWEDTPF